MNTTENQSKHRGWKQYTPVTLFLLAGLVVVLALGWQALIITKLRREVASLRGSLPNAWAGVASDQGQLQKNPEIIKLRAEVRELNERLATARPGKLRELLSTVLPGSRSQPLKLRPDWTRYQETTTNQYAKIMARFKAITNDFERFLALDRAAVLSFAVGRTEDARTFATDMLFLSDQYSRGDPAKANGDVIHNGNLILGRIAVEEGRMEDAKKHLLAAGKSAGSPVLGSFGPNMGLAKDLLEKGEKEVVLQYFKNCQRFWSSPKLEQWIKDVQDGKSPDFGAHLIY